MSVTLTEGVDAGAVWHYGDPLREQRSLLAGRAGVDLSHRPVFAVAGPERLSWLNAITSQELATLPPGEPTISYVLDPQGRISHVFGGVDDGEVLWCHTEPGRLGPLLAWLRRMVFAARVELREPTDVVLALAPGGLAPTLVASEELDDLLGPERAGVWAMEAVRIAAGMPRIFVDTDERTIPNELANPEQERLGPAVHLKKGCYPGQETVARVYNLGRPPRRLTKLHLDGSTEELPTVGAEVLFEGRPVGRMGSAQRHFEEGPIGLALLKRSLPVDAELEVDGIAAAQEVLVNPDAGLHFRPGSVTKGR